MGNCPFSMTWSGCWKEKSLGTWTYMTKLTNVSINKSPYVTQLSNRGLYKQELSPKDWGRYGGGSIKMLKVIYGGPASDESRTSRAGVVATIRYWGDSLDTLRCCALNHLRCSVSTFCLALTNILNQKKKKETARLQCNQETRFPTQMYKSGDICLSIKHEITAL